MIFVGNIKWVEFRVLGETSVRFSFPLPVALLCAAVLVCVAFKEELERLLFRFDGYLLGDMSLKPFINSSARYDLVFVVLAAAFGLLFVFFVPPMFAPDETNHFTRAWLLAHGQLLPSVSDSKTAVGYVTRDLRDFLKAWNAGTWSPGKKLSLDEYRALFSAALSGGGAVRAVDFPYPYLSFFMYIPQAVGILIGEFLFFLFRRPLDYTIYIQLLFARAANLAVYVAAIFMAIRTTPVFKRTLAILTLMPMAIFIASSCSYDVYMYGACILYAAYVFKCAYDPAVRTVDTGRKAVLILLQFLILVGKYVYFPLLFLVFLIPREKFQNRSKKRIFASLALPSAGLLFLWLLAYKISITGVAGDAYSKAYEEQALFVLLHPLKYTAILATNLHLFSKDWATGFVGLFGWLNVPMPMAFVIFYIVLLLLSAVFETVVNESAVPRALLGFVALACYVLIATAEYVVWTPTLGNGKVGQYTIIGVQGRYFIPFAFPLLLMLVNKLPYRTYLFGKIDVWFHRAAPFVLSGTLVYAAVFLLQTYWLP